MICKHPRKVWSCSFPTVYGKSTCKRRIDVCHWIIDTTHFALWKQLWYLLPLSQQPHTPTCHHHHTTKCSVSQLGFAVCRCRRRTYTAPPQNRYLIHLYPPRSSSAASTTALSLKMCNKNALHGIMRWSCFRWILTALHRTTTTTATPATYHIICFVSYSLTLIIILIILLGNLCACGECVWLWLLTLFSILSHVDFEYYCSFSPAFCAYIS